MKSLVKMISILLGICVLMIGYVYATATDPTGPQSISRDSDERFEEDNWPGWNIEAEAGNITALTITSLTQTQTWQGYYGNISGKITLDDASNFTMYDWALNEPQGEIYASNGSSVTWSKIRCVNYTACTSGLGSEGLNLSVLETMFGLASDDVDGVNETFNETGKLSDGTTDHPIVYVGTKTITAGSCPAADIYQNDSSSGTDFVEILLTDNASIVFTTIIENDIVGDDLELQGFNNQTMDFQMIVGDDGHAGDDSITNYYFFVELE